MGLGNLNPGCGCTCEPRPTNDCQEAGEAWHLEGYELTCPLISLGASAVCGALGYGYTISDNATTTRVHIPQWTDPSFACFYSAASGAGLTDDSYNDQLGMWPVWTSSGGNCVIGLANGTMEFGLASYRVPWIANSSVALSKVGSRYALSVSVSVSMFLSLGNTGTCSGIPTTPLISGVAPGANYVQTGATTYREITSRPDYQSTFEGQWFQAPLPGQPFPFPSWCFASGLYEAWTSSSLWTIYKDDPVYGTQRTFTIWEPSPVIDPFDLLTGVSVTVYD